MLLAGNCNVCRKCTEKYKFSSHVAFWFVAFFVIFDTSGNCFQNVACSGCGKVLRF